MSTYSLPLAPLLPHLKANVAFTTGEVPQAIRREWDKKYI
jgi:hypothetical protein